MSDHNSVSEQMPEHISSLGSCLAIWLALLAGTTLTVAAAFIDLGPFNTVVALAIATTKATLVVLFYMHVKY
ncbi:MAG TPA: cytochrome C oxidase subunit IV family protein, partial [Terriglobales bacterium]